MGLHMHVIERKTKQPASPNSLGNFETEQRVSDDAHRQAITQLRLSYIDKAMRCGMSVDDYMKRFGIKMPKVGE